MARLPQPSASALKAIFRVHHHPHPLDFRRSETLLVLRPPIGFGILGDLHGLGFRHLAPGNERGEAEGTQDGFDLGNLQFSIGVVLLSIGIDLLAMGDATLAVGAVAVAIGAVAVAIGAVTLSNGAVALFIGADRVFIDDDLLSAGADRVSIDGDPLSTGADTVSIGGGVLAIDADCLSIGADPVFIGPVAGRFGGDWPVFRDGPRDLLGDGILHAAKVLSTRWFGEGVGDVWK